MLCRTILTLLIASISISRIGAREIGDGRAQLNKTHGDEVNTVIEASTIQKNNTFNNGPNDESIYGSVVKVENTIYESPDSRQPISTQTRTVVAPGGPGYDGVSYAKSEERDHQGQPINKLSATSYMEGNNFGLAPGTKHVFGSYIEQNNNVYRSEGDNNQTQPNEKHISSNIGLTAETILTNNVFQTSGNMTINAGSSITYSGNVYTSDKNSRTGEKTINGTERQDNSSAIMAKIFENVQIQQKRYEEWQNQLYFGNHSSTQQDPTGSKPVSTFIVRDSDPSTQTEKNAQDIKEKEASAEKHKKPNGQASLSPNVFFSFTYFLIILIKLSVFN